MFSKLLVASLLFSTMGSTAVTSGVEFYNQVSNGEVPQLLAASGRVGGGIQSQDKFKGEEVSGTFTPTKSLNIREEPWGKVQTVASKGDELEAIQEVYHDEVTWYQVEYELDGESTIGWASKNYLQDYDDYLYDLENPTYLPNHIYFNGKEIPYKNGGYSQGQYIIDTSNYASTWGGAQVFSGYDGMSTHLIGHSHMQFVGLTDAYTFIVTDSAGNAFQYERNAMYLVNEKGIDVNTGANLYDVITGTWGGERLVLQTTEVHPRKWIITADYVGQVN